MPTRLLPCAALAALVVLSGCRDREIAAYRAPKDPAPVMPVAGTSSGPQALPADHPPVGDSASAPAPGAAMASTPVPTAGGAGLQWTAPASWTPKTGSSMRRGSYALKHDGLEADLAITAFPGDTGGFHANLNRWRGQVGLPPATPAELDAVVQHLDGQGGLHFEVLDVTGTAGTPPIRLLGAIASYNGNSWFFKLMGPAPVVEAEKAAYFQFLQTVKTP